MGTRGGAFGGVSGAGTLDDDGVDGGGVREGALGTRGGASGGVFGAGMLDDNGADGVEEGFGVEELDDEGADGGEEGLSFAFKIGVEERSR